MYTLSNYQTKAISVLIFILFSMSCISQDELNRVKGLRLERGNKDVQMFLNGTDNKPVLKDFRKLNSTVFFRMVGTVKQETDGKTYVLITIPGDNPNKAVIDPENDPRNGDGVGPADYDRNFWVDEEDIKGDLVKSEFVKYQPDLIAGVLTAPFKGRLKVGNAKGSYVDGSFNAGSFIGGKLSLGAKKPTYISLVGFLEFTTITFNSSNNTSITDSKATESGSGYSYGVGLILRIAGVSPGVIVGWDHGLGDNGASFIYQDKPWISVSLNFDFFKPKVDDSSTNK